jgi:Protein of unknown function (DUF2971)
MRIYHFLNEKYGKDDIQRKRLKISRLMDLNDPFEFLSADLSNREMRKVLRETKLSVADRYGIICFCKTWRNPVMWGHYADRHRGICLGFDVADHLAMDVEYVESRLDWPNEVNHDFVEKLLRTKFLHWSYEEEVRLHCTLEEEEKGFYFKEFSDEIILKEVILGSECSLTIKEVKSILGNESGHVSVFKSRPAFTKFEIVKDQKIRKELKDHSL